MNKFRERLLSGKPPQEQLLRPKTGRSGSLSEEDGGLDRLVIARDAARTSNHREAERHRLLKDEQAVASWNGRDFTVTIINLSGGGAMIEAPFQPRLWDWIDLSLGGCGTIECAVRWISGDRVGLEFAHETRLDTAPETRTALLREVVQRSFPDVELQAQPQPAEPESLEQLSVQDAARRSEQRHPLVWSGQIHFNHSSTLVRLRNISATGALVGSERTFPVRAELLLDLGEAGSVFSTVTWAHGDQCGLRFHEPFDIGRLAQARPQLAPAKWATPDYLRDSGESSPWAARWNRLTIGELRRTLGS